jgi:ribonuclease BN (tRNA processing enzyme)
MVVEEVSVELHDADVHRHDLCRPVDARGWPWRDAVGVGAMKLTVLGSNASSPSRTNAASGYLVQFDGTRVLMDAGPGVFMKLAEIMDPGALDAVVLSHTHVDHCADVLALFTYMAYGPSGSIPIPVYAPEGSGDHIAAFARAGKDHVFHQVLDFREQEPGDQIWIGDAHITFGKAIHPVPALVTRFDIGDRSFIYSGDTGPGGDLANMASGASLALFEASLQGVRGPKTFSHHLTAIDAGELATWADVERLVLTHIPARLDPVVSVEQASSVYSGPVSYAAAGSTFEISTTR